MHDLEIAAFSKLVNAIAKASNSLDSEKEAQTELERKGYVRILMGEFENLVNCPPEPIYCDESFMKFFTSTSMVAWVDMIYAMCSDINRVTVNRSDLLNLLDFTESNQDALYGSHEILKHQIYHQEHYTEKLDEARKNKRHW